MAAWWVRCGTALLCAAVPAARIAADERPPTTSGWLVMAPEVETFQPCAAAEPLWVEGDPALLKAMRAQYEQIFRSPYERMFAVVEGKPGPKLDCGFCAAYPGSFHIDRLISQRRREKGDCGGLAGWLSTRFTPKGSEVGGPAGGESA